MTARYETKVHAKNRAHEYGIPVTVYAENRGQAVERAIEIGWPGRADDARVTFFRIEEVPPTCGEGTDGR